MAKFSQINTKKPIILLGRFNDGILSDLINGVDEIYIKKSKDFIEYIKKSKHFTQLENDLQCISERKEENGIFPLLSTWMDFDSFKKMIKDWKDEENNFEEICSKWEKMGVNEVSLDGYKK